MYEDGRQYTQNHRKPACLLVIVDVVGLYETVFWCEGGTRSTDISHLFIIVYVL